MNRKTFLGNAALASGALLLSGLAKGVAQEAIHRSLPKEKTEEKEVIVIGSGYGGAVAALRLAEKGHKVTLLEMGLNWEKSGQKFSTMLHPGNSAAWLRNRTIAPFFNLFPLKKFTGALDRWDFDNIKIWMGRGVGGGSLVNGGMAVLPRRDYFREILPQLNDAVFYEKYFPLVQKELQVNVASEAFLADCRWYKFSRVGEEQARAAGFKTVRVPNVYDFDYMEAECRGDVPRSALAGEVIYGNNYGKASLDKSYLKKAAATGNLEILDLHEVEHLTRNSDDTYTLDVKVINTSGAEVARKTIHTPKVFLAAGVMGTLKLLLRSAARKGLPIDDQVGRKWGNNGNFMTGRNWVNAFSGGTGLNHSTIPVGGIDNWDDPEHPFFTEIAPLPMGLNAATTLYLMLNRVPQLDHVGYDTAADRLTLRWSDENTAPMLRNAKFFIKKMNKANGGTRAHLLFHNGWGPDVCYHPLGGVALGAATDAFGRLNGHQNLYVVDGSLIPGTIGVNPFLTITAVAEYCLEHILEQDFRV